MKQQLRRAKPKDKDAIIKIAISTKVFTKEEITCLEQDFENLFAEKDPEDTFLTYEGENGIPQGFIHYGPLPITNRGWCLHWIAVNKSVQGKGLGYKLVERMEKDIARKYGRVIFIETSSKAEYDSTRKFYMKCEYFPVAVLPEYYNIYDSKVVFSKNLLSTSVREGMKSK